ncbi:coiled-coil domain-containing protein [Clostridium oryzae]|uniref:Uncharacterized protein n=1 Tax=Clostridium oryzae TaxID=1450648 RepID=A0A1V4IUH8_9CLOT|nr:hypothetical protein [Clostridium oryzae]OPJ63553.1 hypothetical protein CLORY_10610 [Clostridium oryzae]
MKSIPWIYYDAEGYLKRLYLTENGDLVRETLYQNKWTDKQQIDSDVVDMSLYEDMSIVYIKKKGILKLAEWKDNSWKNETIYEFKELLFGLYELKSYMIDGKINIFVLNKKSVKNAFIVHLIYDGSLKSVNTVCSLQLVNEAVQHYEVEYNLNEKVIDIIFITKEGSEAVIKTTQCKNELWKIPVKLYGIKGKNAEFKTLSYNNRTNILNCSREYSTYCLEHVALYEKADMVYNNIYETTSDIDDITIVNINDILYAVWKEDQRIFWTANKKKWTNVSELKVNNADSIILCRFSNLSDRNIVAKYVFLQIDPDVKVLMPEFKSVNAIESSSSIFSNSGSTASSYKKAEKREELLYSVSENYDKKIQILKYQLEEKEKNLGVLKAGYARITDAKRKSDENLEIMNGIHENMLNEFEQFKKQQETLKKEVDKLRQELKIKIVESENMKKKVDSFIEENDILKKQLEQEKNRGILKMFKKNRN